MSHMRAHKVPWNTGLSRVEHEQRSRRLKALALQMLAAGGITTVAELERRLEAELRARYDDPHGASHTLAREAWRDYYGKRVTALCPGCRERHATHVAQELAIALCVRYDALVVATGEHVQGYGVLDGYWDAPAADGRVERLFRVLREGDLAPIVLRGKPKPSTWQQPIDTQEVV